MPDIHDISSHPFALQPGTILHQYVITRAIGRGGFTITYLGQDEYTKNQVVIKENFPSALCIRGKDYLNVAPLDKRVAAAYHISLHYFMDRATAYSKLAHPNIVPICRCFIENGTGYYVMPHIEGQPLNRVARRQDTPSGEWLMRQLKTLLSALEYLHRNEFLHRNIKPDSIIINHAGDPVLIEMRLYGRLDKLQICGYVEATPYEAIEEVENHDKLGPWTDLYSLGATFYTIITGEHPPIAMDRIIEDCYSPLAENSSYTSRYPLELLSSIDKALNLHQKNRWQSAQEWLDALNTPPRKCSQGREKVASQSSPLRAFFEKILSALTKKKEKKS